MRVRKEYENKQITFYRQFNLFQDFSQNILTVLDLFAEKLTFQRGNVVIEQNQNVTGIYLLESGCVRVRNNS